jgi:hypothetical protein
MFVHALSLHKTHVGALRPLPHHAFAYLFLLAGKATVPVQPWDRVRILTPGGGGYGRAGDAVITTAGAGLCCSEYV